jgi:tetratricopeptide (TPR) repeat protein
MLKIQAHRKWRRTRRYRVTVLTLTIVATSFFSAIAQREATKTPASPEAVAFMNVRMAGNPAAKLAAAEDFVAKFPSSSRRLEVAEMVATQISTVRNPAVAVGLVDRARAIFTGQDELEFIKPVALEIFADAGRADEAFQLAAEILGTKPDELWILIKMAFLGAQEAKKRNQKYVEISVSYGTRAIEIIEADQKPRSIDAESWIEQKSSLPNLYQQIGILNLAQGRTEEAKTLFNKAAKLGPKDPANFALLGRVLNAEYEKSMVAYEAMVQSKTKEEEKKKLELLLDEIIDKYARAAGLATGKPEHQSLLQQVIPDLTNYYKYRHNQSTTGLRQLINKYRVP